MPYVTGEERTLFFMISLEESVNQNAYIRVIDAFVEAIDLQRSGFTHACCKG